MKDLELLKELLEKRENEHLEFKEARTQYDFDTLVKYCSALANEKGGRIILGVTDKKPRKVVGTRAFEDIERIKHGLYEQLRLKIEAVEIKHPDGRVLIFTSPSRPLGVPVAYKGSYYMRAGESIVPMTPDQLKKIFDESGPDFSAEFCQEATIEDLDTKGISNLKSLWQKKSRNKKIANLTLEQVLTDLELISNRKVCYAALVLVGKKGSLSRLLPQTEIIFEYRSSEKSGPASNRVEYRNGFLAIHDDLWETINLRNEMQHLRDKMFIWDIPTFRAYPQIQ